jgi:hypothetical protein
MGVKLRTQRIRKPIPPKSVVRLASFSKDGVSWRRKVGQILRLGYYGPNDGLDCIWLGKEGGDYQETTDHAYLFKYFAVIQLSEEKNLFGRRKKPIGPIIPASSRPAGRAKRLGAL